MMSQQTLQSLLKFLPSVTHLLTPDRRQSKTLILSTNEDQKYLETVFNCYLTLFLAIIDPRSSIVKSVFDCHISGVFLVIQKTVKFTVVSP